MLTLKKFVQAVQQSVEAASKSLISQNQEFLETYFDEIDVPRTDLYPSEKDKRRARRKKDNDDDLEGLLIPKMVAMEYPHLAPDGSATHHTVHVPLISLAPHALMQIEDMTFNIEMDIHEDSEKMSEDGSDPDLLISFPTKPVGTRSRPASKSSGKKDDTISFTEQESDSGKSTNVEITISMRAVDQPHGLQVIIDGYDKALRAQVPN